MDKTRTDISNNRFGLFKETSPSTIWVIFVSQSKFLKGKYFVFVFEFQIIEKYSSGKGKEVSVNIFLFQMNKKWTD